MVQLIARHNVEDYGAWRQVFDSHEAFRRESGSLGTTVLHDLTDPTNVVVIIEWPDLQTAQAFATSPNLRETMSRAGVVGKPDVYFLEPDGTRPA